MKATADAVQVQAQNSITLGQIWEPQMQHHELQKCRTEHAAGQRPLLPQSQRAGEQRRHDEDRRTDDGESVKVATTGSNCSTPLPAAQTADARADGRQTAMARTGAPEGEKNRYCCSLLLRLDLRVWGYWRSRPREGRSILPGTVQRR